MRKMPVKWVIIFGIAEFILLILSLPFITKLLGVNMETPLHSILKGKEYISVMAFAGWILVNVAFVIFIIAVIPKSKLSSWEVATEQVFQDLGIAFSKKTVFWGYSFFEGTYQGLKLKCSLHIGSESSPNFLDIRIFHLQPLNLGITLKSRGAAVFDAGEGRDIFAKTIKPADSSLSGIEIYAKKKEAVENTLYSAKITEPLHKLADIFKGMGGMKTGFIDKLVGDQNGFYMTDKYISIRLLQSAVTLENSGIIKELIKAAFELGQAFTTNVRGQLPFFKKGS